MAMRRSLLLPLAAALLAVPALLPQEQQAIPDVVERAAPAVVSIYSSRAAALRPFWWWPFSPEDSERWSRGREQSLGSGVIVGADGLIVTNFHVIEQAREIRVVLPDRREFKPHVVGTDRKTDLALLRIDAKDLPTLRWGDSGKMRVGETVLAIGNPLGVGQTVSRGILSATGRANVGVAEYEDFLQTDAAINPGNSGGALINLRGELIGINTAIASRTGRFEGIGFAIPSAMAQEVIRILLREGRVSRGQMGILVQDMTPQLAKAMPGAPEQGVLVSDVQPKSPAEKVGLRRGDIILKVNGEPVTTATRLRNRVALLGAGAEVMIEVWRDRQVHELTVRLRKEDEAEAPEPEEPAVEPKAGSASGLEGISVTPATPELLRRLNLPRDLTGLIVTSVDPERASVFSGLAEGDLIVEVNRKPVKAVAEMRKAVERDGREAALLTVRRPTGTVFIAVPRE